MVSQQMLCILLNFITWALLKPTGSQWVDCPLPSPDPLLLTPYILNNDTETARNLSMADPSCLEDFVPQSHSGYITVNESLGNHLFFWYFPHQSNLTAPLLVWLNGGPGMSSMQGLLFQNGPIQINDEEENFTDYTERNHSFVRSFSVLYIDNPVEVGYSFSDSGVSGFRLTQEEIGTELLEFMKQFVELFPQYQTDNEVYIGGQSYAGKYVPSMGYYIHQSKMRGESNINLKGVYLSAPLFDPETGFEYIHDFYFFLGMITNKTASENKQYARDEFTLFKNGSLENDSLYRVLSVPFPHMDLFPSPVYLENYVTGKGVDRSKIDHLMNSSRIRSALHTGTNREYTHLNFNYNYYMYKDFRVSLKDKLAVLMDNYKVLIYNGDYDVMTNTISIEAGLMVTPWTGLEDYKNATRYAWRDGGTILGYFSEVGRFCRVIVGGAGHQVGFDQPYSNRVLLEQFVRHGCVSSGQ